MDAVQKFTDAYNAIRKFFDEQRQPGAPLFADSMLRGVVDSFTAALRTEVASNATFSRLTIAGVTLDRTGVLTFNADTLRTAMSSAPEEVEALFGFSGVGGAFVTATDNATRFGDGPISLQINSINANTVILRSREVEAQKRLDLRREQLIAQYTRMEEAMSRLQAQSGSLLASVKGLNGNN